MLILIIDTTVDACSVALARDGAVLVSESEVRRRGHAEELIPMVQRVVDTAGEALAEVNHILVTTGPGTFTGVRIGVSAARGLRLAIADATLCGIDTLQALALSSVGQRKQQEGAVIASVIDARRGDLYAAIYRVNSGAPEANKISSGELPLETLMLPTRCTVDEMKKTLADYAADDVHLVGSGSALLEAGGAGQPTVHLAAPNLSVLADWAELICAQACREEVVAPLYLRPPDAELPRPTAMQRALQGSPQDTSG